LGRVHFWLSLIFMNLIFLPMFLQGLDGMHRRMYDGGAAYLTQTDPETMEVAVLGISALALKLNAYISHAAWALGLAQIPFVFNLFWSINRGRKVTSDNPWGATTLEWATPTPPPHGNFAEPPVAHRGPYEYSVPGQKDDFTPQNQTV
jgi:cytochrome c oxidase subunit 1